MKHIQLFTKIMKKSTIIINGLLIVLYMVCLVDKKCKYIII